MQSMFSRKDFNIVIVTQVTFGSFYWPKWRISLYPFINILQLVKNLYLKPKKGTPFAWSLPIWAIMWSTPQDEKHHKWPPEWTHLSNALVHPQQIKTRIDSWLTSRETNSRTNSSEWTVSWNLRDLISWRANEVSRHLFPRFRAFLSPSPPALFAPATQAITSLSIRRFWGKRGKMEAKKGESWRGEIVRFWMCHTICWMVLCQAFLSLLRLPLPDLKSPLP